jgi:hypothetical protein
MEVPFLAEPYTEVPDQVSQMRHLVRSDRSETGCREAFAIVGFGSGSGRCFGATRAGLYR